MTGAKDISLVIPVYGNVELLKRSLDSIDPDHPRIIVSDDSPQPIGTMLRVGGETSDFFLRLYENMGDAWAKDAGLEKVTTPFVCFVDSDARALTPAWWEYMVYEFQFEPLVGAVGAKLLYTNGNIQHAGVSVKKGIPSHDYDSRDSWYEPANERREVDAVTGSVMMMRTDVARQFPFSTGYRHGYFTDIDLCMRLRKAGYKIIYQPKAVFEHVTSASYALIDKKKRQEWLDYNIRLFQSRWADFSGAQKTEDA